MNFSDAVSACFSKYVTFSGRARRSEYWYFYLFYVLTLFSAAFLEVLVGVEDILSTAVYIGLILPLWAAGVRRMHDTNRSGWWLLAPVINLVFLATDGDTGANRFGDPVK